MRFFKLTILVLIVSAICICCSQSIFETLSFLEGTWKAEDKNLYEEWEVNNDGLIGKSYKITNGEEEISETLKISASENEVFYTAKVFNQNEGSPISFKLNEVSESIFSFENPDHDFPQKIIYERKSDSLIYVNVLGSDGEGFSFNMKKIKADE